MRLKRTSPRSIFDRFAAHEIGHELKAMSALLDGHPALLDSVARDLGSDATTGRCGMTAESVLRCALLKQYRQLSYEELAFHVLDSASFQAFARLPMGRAPSRATLQANIAAITEASWATINARLLGVACAAGVERGTRWRVDSTAIEAPVHPPSDSSLLLDGVRGMVRLLKAGEALPGAPALEWHNHTRRAKRRARATDHSRGQAQKRVLYRDLIQVTEATLGYLLASATRLNAAGAETVKRAVWQSEVEVLASLVAQVIDQTRRRVFAGEKVPAAEKIVSLYEPHTDIIVKDGRGTTFGHKLNLASGRSGLIFDVVIESGNPADGARFMPMLERHIERFGRVPRQIAADGGYASQANLARAKAEGVMDVAFHKKRDLTIEQMVKSRWVYRKLRNFRAGIESGISCLKRAYGLARCTWKGLAHFKAYVWASVVAYNIALLARLTAT
jgi:IS5 family transposase